MKNSKENTEMRRNVLKTANYEAGDMWSRATARLARRRIRCCLDSYRGREREIRVLSVAGFEVRREGDLRGRGRGRVQGVMEVEVELNCVGLAGAARPSRGRKCSVRYSDSIPYSSHCKSLRVSK